MGEQFELFPGTDLATAEWLAGELKSEWRYDHTAERWHHWDGVRWAPDQTEQVKLAAGSAAATALLAGHRSFGADMTKALTKLMSMSPQSSVLEALATLPGYGTNGDDWDAIPYLLGCSNGIVDLRTNTLVAKPGPELLVTKSTKTKFVALEGPEAFDEAAPVFMTVLREWMSDDESMVAFLLLWFGASLFGFTPEQRFLLMTGIGRNGKGALKHSVLRAIGEYGNQLDANLYMRSKFGAARSDQARRDLLELKGLRVAFFSEPEGGRFNEEMLKAHTGGDRITARALFSNNVQSWDPTHSITFLTNEAPEVDDLGPSMAARVMVADFRERYDGDKEDKQLYGKLEREAVGVLGILCWAASAWFESWEAGGVGITLPERVVEQSRAFMERNDPVANWLNARATFDRSSSTPSQLAFDSFGEWVKGEGGELPFSQVRFALELGKKGFTKRKTERGMVWLGFRLLGAMAIAERDGEDDGDEDDPEEN